jgi:DnaJ-class molecular chaperone
VAVVVEEVIHGVFTRSGADLVVKFYVSLEEALLGCALEIPALDGRTLRVRVTDIIT